MRHAKSDRDRTDLQDIDRPLNHRGEKDAPGMGKRIHQLGFKPDLLICSVALRTYETARYVAKELHLADEDIQKEFQLYEASMEDIVHVIRSVDDRVNKLLLIGHNPGFTGILGYLGNAFVENLPTAGAALLEFDVQTWQMIRKASGKQIWFDFPKNK